MILQKILERLCDENKHKHRLTVDSHPADALFLDGTDLICRMQEKPQSPTTIDIYLGHTESENSEIRTGQYDLIAKVLNCEASEKGWRVSLRILNPNTELVNRKSDRWKTPVFPIHYRKKNTQQIKGSRVLDFSAEGMAIEREDDFQIGEIVEIFGLAENMKMPLRDPIEFEVRILPTPKKAGLMLRQDAPEELRNSFKEFSSQLRQFNRFWNSFLEIIRTHTGYTTNKETLPSCDFICRQLKRKETVLNIHTTSAIFEEVSDAISFFERFERLKEDLARLEEEKSKMEPMTLSKIAILTQFLSNQSKY